MMLTFAFFRFPINRLQNKKKNSCILETSLDYRYANPFIYYILYLEEIPPGSSTN